MLQRFSHRFDEQRLAAVLVVPTERDRAPVRTALSITRGRRGRLRALCLTRPGEGLPPELRIALFGLSGTSEADLAIKNLISSATRGAHTAVHPIGEQEEERREQAAQLAALDPDLPLLVGWSRTGPLPRLDRLLPLIEGFRGYVVLLADTDGPLPTEVLGLLPAPGDRCRAAVEALVCDLERTLPAYRVAEAKARGAIQDCTDRTLVVAALPPQTDLESAVPGRVALVLAPTPDRSEVIAALFEQIRLGRQTRAASAAVPPPPRPAL